MSNSFQFLLLYSWSKLALWCSRILLPRLFQFLLLYSNVYTFVIDIEKKQQTFNSYYCIHFIQHCTSQYTRWRFQFLLLYSEICMGGWVRQSGCFQFLLLYSGSSSGSGVGGALTSLSILIIVFINILNILKQKLDENFQFLLLYSSVYILADSPPCFFATFNSYYCIPRLVKRAMWPERCGNFQFLLLYSWVGGVLLSTARVSRLSILIIVFGCEHVWEGALCSGFQFLLLYSL